MSVANVVSQLNETYARNKGFAGALEAHRGWPLRREAFPQVALEALAGELAPKHLPNELLELLGSDVAVAPFENDRAADRYVAEARQRASSFGRDGLIFRFGRLAGLSLFCWLRDEPFESSPVITHIHDSDLVQVVAPAIRSWLACWSAMIDVTGSEFPELEWGPQEFDELSWGWPGLDTEIMVGIGSRPEEYWRRLGEVGDTVTEREAPVAPQPWVAGERGLGMTRLLPEDHLTDEWSRVVWNNGPRL